jgi:SpoVK/Ycf46/Vps4 family AAA+-type ATPase
MNNCNNNGTRNQVSDKKLIESTSSLKSSYSPIVTFADVIGCDEAKQTLLENIILPLTLDPVLRKQIFTGYNYNISISNINYYKGIREGAGNVLLHGPPGTGKTLLAQATAHECGATLLSICPSDILSKYQGDSERAIRNLFETARTSNEPVIVFFDGNQIYNNNNNNNNNNRI